MKFVEGKLLQKAKGRKKGKYLITLEVTDYDLEMLEDFSHTYEPYCEAIEHDYVEPLKEKYQKWMNKTWRQFWKLLDLYDEN